MLFSAGGSSGGRGLASASGIVSPPSPSPPPAMRHSPRPRLPPPPSAESRASPPLWAAGAASGAADPSAARRHPAGFSSGIHAAASSPARRAPVPMLPDYSLNLVCRLLTRLTAAPADTASMRAAPRVADPLRPRRLTGLLKGPFAACGLRSSAMPTRGCISAPSPLCGPGRHPAGPLSSACLPGALNPLAPAPHCRHSSSKRISASSTIPCNDFAFPFVTRSWAACSNVGSKLNTNTG